MVWLVLASIGVAALGGWALSRGLAVRRATARFEDAHEALEQARRTGDSARAIVQEQRAKDAHMTLERLKLW